MLQQVLGGNEEVVVTAGKKGPKNRNAFYQLEVRLAVFYCSQDACTLPLLRAVLSNVDADKSGNCRKSCCIC